MPICSRRGPHSDPVAGAGPNRRRGIPGDDRGRLLERRRIRDLPAHAAVHRSGRRGPGLFRAAGGQPLGGRFGGLDARGDRGRALDTQQFVAVGGCARPRGPAREQRPVDVRAWFRGIHRAAGHRGLLRRLDLFPLPHRALGRSASTALFRLRDRCPDDLSDRRPCSGSGLDPPRRRECDPRRLHGSWRPRTGAHRWYAGTRPHGGGRTAAC